MMIRVLLADDNKLWRDGVCLLHIRSHEFEIVGQARDGKEAVELAVRLKPDVVLMDIRMPVMDGLNATREIASSKDHPAILIVAMTHDAALVRQALNSGAKGYVAKHEFVTELVPAIRAVYEGKTYLSPIVAKELGSHRSK